MGLYFIVSPRAKKTESSDFFFPFPVSLRLFFPSSPLSVSKREQYCLSFGKPRPPHISSPVPLLLAYHPHASFPILHTERDNGDERERELRREALIGKFRGGGHASHLLSRWNSELLVPPYPVVRGCCWGHDWASLKQHHLHQIKGKLILEFSRFLVG